MTIKPNDHKDGKVKRIWIPQAVISFMLVWALNPENPYAYYILLRWVCCPVFAYLAFQALSYEKKGWVWILGVTAAIYNPIFIVHLNRVIWSVVNIATILIAIASIYLIIPNSRKPLIGGLVCSNCGYEVSKGKPRKHNVFGKLICPKCDSNHFYKA